jgi:allantoicase
MADLASRWLGGSVLAASDESFGDKENLLTPGPAAFEPGHYGNRGEIVDGWETRRRRDAGHVRDAGHDWALIRLGAPGMVTSVDVDTSFFTGNYPPQCRVEACGREGYPSPAELAGPGTDWAEIVPRSALRGDAHNTFAVSDPRRFTHVRLSVFPDGGVARLRVHGEVVPDPRGLERLTIDLASQEYGGAVVASSDDFYTAASTLNRPDRARTMGEGWETQRRRDSGHDFVIVQLAFAGEVRQLIVDTAHFKYNASGEIAVYGRDEEPSTTAAVTGASSTAVPSAEASPSVPSAEASPAAGAWVPLLRRTRLQPDTRHVFAVDHAGAVASIRLDAFPDGGLSRVRVTGSIDPAARRRAGYRWFNSLPASQARQCLADAGVPADVAADLLGQRPLPETWLEDTPGQDSPGNLTTGTADLSAIAAILHGARSG